jgi:hypothetical protein
MAYGDTFRPAGISREVKVRGPVWVGIFSFVAILVYAVYWFYVTAKDLSEYGKAKGHDLGQNPTMSLLAVLFGWILIGIPTIIAFYRFTRRVQAAQRLAGSKDVLNGWLALVLILVFSPLYDAYVQSELNKAWAAEGGPVPVDEPYVGEALPSAEQPSTATTQDPLTTTQPTQPSVGDSPERPGA